MWGEKMNTYGSQYVLCPFFIRDDDSSITCEGMEANMCSRHVFRTDKGNLLKDKKKEFINKYCMADYKGCMYAEMLEKKYE